MEMETATTSTMAESTSIETPLDHGVTRRGHAAAQDTPTTTTPPPDTLANGSANSPDALSANATDELRRAFRNKYRHVQAVHSQSKPSCLSHDTTETPSFLGFRNLMVIVLGRSSVDACVLIDTALTPIAVAANLRLVIENIQKVGTS
jgi:diacylglycerol O-acyltransferase-1